ncbi:hypothetical protein [Compostibacter hankyongensis]|uniref:Lipoprotein n=1 Tax=Compostibacter hankyongensis TaxID=1007089 RepID=A0ABP8GA17_9BACT
MNLMVLKILPAACLLSISVAGCTGHKYEQQLAGREQNLLEREKQFAEKEADYQSLLRMRDSLLSHHDTVATLSWPAAVAGRWNSKVICKESNCSNYVIGDQWSGSWEFTSDSTGMFVKVTNNDKLIRVFSGSFNKEEILLHFATDSSIQKKADMSVVLRKIDSNLMKGTQILSGDNNCTARFSVELVPASNN